MEGNWQGGVNGQNKYQYNGKELNQDFGLDWNDYGARFYDAAIGRWPSIDPLADQYFKWSPYNFCIANPMNIIDPNGREIKDIAGGVRFTEQDAVNAFNFITSSAKNVYVTLFTNGNVQNETQKQQGAWRVLAVNNLGQANTVLGVLGVGKGSVDNMVIEGHGMGEYADGTEVDRGLLNGDSGNMRTGDIERSKLKGGFAPKYVDELAAHLSSNFGKVPDLANILSYISADGKLVLNACQVGKGSPGQSFARALGDLAGNRFNIYLNISDSPIFNIGTDGAYHIATGSRNYDNKTSKGWIHLNPQGTLTTGTVKDVHINLIGNPIQIKY